MADKESTARQQVVCFGEILWDILPKGAVPGGAPMNVAYHLHHLGAHPALVTRIGNDERGKALLEILHAKHIDTSFVQTDEDIPTGIVHATPDAKGDMKYEIVAPAAWDHISSNDATEALVRDAGYLVFGSLVARNAISKKTLLRLIGLAKNKILDINLRTPFYNQAIVEELLALADIAKMNIEELELITNWLGNFSSTEERMTFILDRFTLRSLIVTKGAEGAIVNVNGTFYRHPGYKVKVADTIGSGDSFLAAFLAKMIANKPVAEALNFASAMGAMVASKVGGWPEYTIAEIEATASGKNNNIN